MSNKNGLLNGSIIGGDPLEEVSQPDTCGSCRFCARIGGDLRQGQCRGAPPTPVVVGVTQQGPMIQSLFPAVELRTPACGRYERRQEVMIGRPS